MLVADLMVVVAMARSFAMIRRYVMMMTSARHWKVGRGRVHELPICSAPTANVGICLFDFLGTRRRICRRRFGNQFFCKAWIGHRRQ